MAVGSPNTFYPGESQLRMTEDFRTRAVAHALERAAATGKTTARAMVKIELYDPPVQEGLSGRYLSWSGMRWKHDLASIAAGRHFAETIDTFIALYQRDPEAVRQLLEAQDFPPLPQPPTRRAPKAVL